MNVRFFWPIVFFLAFLIVALPAFAEGEWENPDDAPGAEPSDENGDSPPDGDDTSEEAEEEQIGEPDSQESSQDSLESVGDLDEPELEPPEDTFPVVRANEAPAPRPRDPHRILDAVDIESLTDKLYVDRLLLSEIRKDVPEAREEAEPYLIRLKQLAEKSDPVRLVPLFDRVLDQAPIYFTWLDTEFESQDEQITEYYVGGARGFAFAMENFRSAVFLVIMNRLDIASRVISALEEE